MIEKKVEVADMRMQQFIVGLFIGSLLICHLPTCISYAEEIDNENSLKIIRISDKYGEQIEWNLGDGIFLNLPEAWVQMTTEELNDYDQDIPGSSNSIQGFYYSDLPTDRIPHIIVQKMGDVTSHDWQEIVEIGNVGLMESLIEVTDQYADIGLTITYDDIIINEELYYFQTFGVHTQNDLNSYYTSVFQVTNNGAYSVHLYIPTELKQYYSTFIDDFSARISITELHSFAHQMATIEETEEVVIPVADEEPQLTSEPLYWYIILTFFMGIVVGMVIHLFIIRMNKKKSTKDFEDHHHIDSKFCRYCGRSLTLESRYCDGCGKHVD